MSDSEEYALPSSSSEEEGSDYEPELGGSDYEGEEQGAAKRKGGRPAPPQPRKRMG